MKVYCLFQRFREQNEDIDSQYFDDKKGADLIKIFLTREKAEKFKEEMFQEYLGEQEGDFSDKEYRDFWEDDFNTFIEAEEIYDN